MAYCKYHRGRSFNTQPPEGGWICLLRLQFGEYMFQHTAARRRLVRNKKNKKIDI